MKIFIFLMSLFIASHSFAEVSVIVKKNDSLSMIIYSLAKKRIYGPNGLLEKTLELNPQYKSNPNLIHAGEVVILPIDNHSDEKLVSDLAEEVSIEPSMGELPVQSDENQYYEVQENIDLKTHFGLKLGASLLRINGNNVSGVTGSMGSTLSPSVEVFFTPKIAERMTAEIGAGYTATNFTKDNDQKLTNNQQNLLNIYGGINYYLSQRLSVGLQLAQTDNAFYTFENSIVSVKKLSLLNSTLSGKYKAFDLFSMPVFLKLGYEHSFSKSSGPLTINSGRGYLGSISIEKNIFNHEMFTEFLIKRTHYSAKPGDFKNDQATLSVGIKF